MTRVAFGPAVTVVHPLSGNEGALAEVVCGLLYPDTSGDDDSDPLKRLVDPAADVSRVGILLRGRDGVSYRILRDLKTAKWSVLKEGAGGFSPISSRPADVAQLVTASIGFPQSDVFREVFVTRRADLPSQRADAFGSPPPLPPDASGPMPVVPAGYGGQSEFSSLSDDEKRLKLKQVQDALAHNANIRVIETELDGLQREVFHLDEQLGHIDGYLKAVETANKALAEYAHLQNVPDDFSDRVARLSRNIEGGKRDIKRIHEERAGVEQQLARELQATPTTVGVIAEAFQDKHILAGSAVGVFGILLGVIGAFSFEPLRYAAFLDVPGFGVALYGAWRFIGDAEGTSRLRYRIERLDADRDQKKAQLAKDEQELAALFERIGYAKEDLLRVEDMLRKRAAARQDAEQAQGSLRQMLADPNIAVAEQKRQELKALVQAAEERLYTTGGYMGDGNELRHQVEELSALLEGRPPNFADIAYSGPHRRAPAAPVAQPVAAPAPAAAFDPTSRLVRHAGDLLQSDIDTTCQMLQARVGQYVAGLSDRRYGQVLFGPGGEMAVVETASGRSMPFAQLTPGDRDLAYLSLKLTIVEASVRRGRLPVLLERAFETIPEVKDPLLLRMAQFLGTVTQVVCMTRKPGLVSAGEHRVTLS